MAACPIEYADFSWLQYLDESDDFAFYFSFVRSKRLMATMLESSFGQAGGGLA